MNSQPSTPINALLETVWDTGELGDLNSTLQHLTDVARRRFEADSWASFVLNHITGEFVPSVALARENGREISSTVLSGLRQSNFLEPLLKERVLLVEDLESAPQYQDSFAGLNDVQSFIAVSLLTKQLRKPLALLYLNFHQPHRFSEDDQKWLRLFIDQASSVLQNSWLLHRFHEITRVGQEINQEFGSIAVLFKKLQKQVAYILDTSHFFMLAIYRGQTENFDLYLSERGQYRSLPDNPLNGGYSWVLQQQEPLLIRQLSQKADHLPVELEMIPGTDPRDRESLIFVPLILEGVPLGLLSVQHPEPNIYSLNDLHILRLLGSYVSSALNNTRIFDDLRELNKTGQLLTQNLGSTKVLQYVINQIRLTTKADLAVLYPYEQANRQFELPPYLSGDLLKPKMLQPDTAQSGDLVTLALHQSQVIFAEDSAALYQTLRSKTKPKKGSFAKREKIQAAAVVPLRVINETVGVLFINFRQPQRFDGLSQQLIRSLGNYAAIAIKNAREFKALSMRRLQELEILREIDQAIGKSLDLQQVLQTILRLANDHISPDKGVILLYDPRTETLVKEAATGREAELSLKKTIPLDQEKGITRWVFQYKKPVRIGNVHRDPHWRDTYLEGSSDILSELDVPLLDGDEVIGVINLESTLENAFSRVDEEFMLTLAGQAVLAIKNARAYEVQTYFLNERQALSQIGREIISQIELDQVFDLILDKALEITQSKAGTLMLFDPRRKDLWMAAEHGVSEEQKGRRHSLAEGITGWVARNRQLLNVGDISKPPWDKVHLPFIANTRSELTVPLLEANNLKGVINLENLQPDHFDDSDERLLAELADLAVIALQNAGRYQKIKVSRARLEALRKVDRKIISQLDDPDQVMRTILQNTVSLTGAEFVSLYLYEVDRLSMIYRAHLEDDQRQEPAIERIETPRLPTGGIVNHVAKTQQSYITLGDAQADPYYMGRAEIRSEVAVPLLAEGETLIGILNLESPRPYAFDMDDVWLLEMFGGQAVIAIQNARAYAQAERRANRFQLLHEAARKLGEIKHLTEIEQAYDIVTQIAEKHSQNQVVIRRYDSDVNELVLVRTAPWQQTPAVARIKATDRGVSPQVARERRTLVVPDIDHPPPGVASPEPSDPRTRSLIVTPIQIEDNYYGNLGVTYQKTRYFSEDDIKLIEGLAQQLAITINRLEAIQAQQEAEQRATQAELMGSIGESAYELTHRLGNNLGLIQTYVNNIHLILEHQPDVLTAEVTTELDKIVRDVRKVLDLSKRLKEELANFSEGTSTPIPANVLIEEAVAAFPHLPPNIQLNIEASDDLARVQAVPGHIKDILYNLVINAIEAMPAGGIITFRARNAHRFVAFEVEDTGPGIPQHKQAQIFNLFFSTKGSSGFGLWSARRKALAQGGDLQVKSQPDQGTTFILLLPRARGNSGGI